MDNVINKVPRAIKTSELIWQDMQHQELFRIIESLAIKPEMKIVHRLLNYVNDHFSIEEAYMKQLHFPDIESHIKAHRHFEDKIKSFISTSCCFDEKCAIELSEYLDNWLINHILSVDKNFEAFVLQSNYK